MTTSLYAPTEIPAKPEGVTFEAIPPELPSKLPESLFPPDAGEAFFLPEEEEYFSFEILMRW